MGAQLRRVWPYEILNETATPTLDAGRCPERDLRGHRSSVCRALALAQSFERMLRDSVDVSVPSPAANVGPPLRVTRFPYPCERARTGRAMEAVPLDIRSLAHSRSPGEDLLWAARARSPLVDDA